MALLQIDSLVEQVEKSFLEVRLPLPLHSLSHYLSLPLVSLPHLRPEAISTNFSPS
jgi:hypothetical protein